MSFAQDFAELLPDTVVVAPFTGRDDYGAPTFGAPVTVKGRLVFRNTMVRRADGAQVVSGSFVRLPPIAGFTAEGQCIVNGQERPVASIQRAPDETGVDYYLLVMFQ